MLTLPTYISLIRAPLAFLFLQNDPLYRSLALLCAMISDGLDGYLARKYHLITPIGTFLDPLMDKFFVTFIVAIFFLEGRLEPWELAAMGCRDFSIYLFGCYLLAKGRWKTYKFRAIWCGKITTCLQFGVLLALTWEARLPQYLYSCFLMLGVCALIELYLISEPQAALKHEI